MFCKSFLNISKNVKYFMPSIRTGVIRRFSDDCDEEDEKADPLALNSELECALNDHIHLELNGFYANIAMVEYFGRTSVSLPGFAKAHACGIDDGLCTVKKLVLLLSQRGGNLSLKPIDCPDSKDWQCPLDVERYALQLEKSTAQSLMNVANMAAQCQDHYVSFTINSSLMIAQIQIINELEQRKTKLEQCASPNCLLLLDDSLNKKN